jgi:hypothetical protein
LNPIRKIFTLSGKLAAKQAMALLAALLLSRAAAIGQVERLTTVSEINMTVNNIGLIGNAFKGSFNTLDYPSCQFPSRSGVEHIFQGGLWVGATINGQQFVTTGASDASAGYSPGVCNFEFTTQPNAPLLERSSLIRNAGYNPRAVSHQDFLADFTDTNMTVPGTNIDVDQACGVTESRHRPLNLAVHMETYNWNYSYANFFVILNYTIKNIGTETLDSLSLGYWEDMVVRNIRKTRPGGTPFFDKGGNGFMDSLHMAYAFDAAGDLGFTESYVGLKFLGADFLRKTAAGQDTSIFIHPERLGGQAPGMGTGQVFYNIWNFGSSDPNFQPPRNELSRYSRLTTGQNFAPNWAALQPQLKKASNRISLVSLAPIRHFAPGESVRIVFAVVCARKKEDGLPNTADNDYQRQDLASNSFWAQTTFNGEDRNFNGALDDGEDQNGDGVLTRFTLPEPPQTPVTKMVAGPNSATLYWADNAENSIDPITKKKDFRGYRVYKSRFAFDLENVQAVTSSLELYKGFDKYASATTPFLEPIPEKGRFTFEGDSNVYAYKYAINNLENGWQHVVALTAYDSGNVANRLPSLESAQLDNLFRVFPGTEANGNLKSNKPFVYPNPYYGSAAWEGTTTRPEEKRLMFANLPKHCKVRILTQAGDFVDEFEHKGETYNGSDSQWYNSFSDPSKAVLSGGEHAWDLLTRNAQIIARGMYLYYVQDLDSKKEYMGSFVVVK